MEKVTGMSNEQPTKPEEQDGQTQSNGTSEKIEPNSSEERITQHTSKEGLGEGNRDIENTRGDNPSLDEIEEGLEQHEEIVDEFAHVVEALVFASDEPLSANIIKNILDSARTFGRVTVEAITGRIKALNKKYEEEGAGFHIVEIAGGFQFATKKEMAQWVSLLFKERARRKLTKSALETLAIIAYKQPITKPEIESIRGVNIDYVLHSLLEKELVTVIGRAETVGRPLLYGTTQKFLKVFNLKNLEDLPKLREIDEIIKEIRSRGAEEPIQLEISALTESPTDTDLPSNLTANTDEQ
jgi:segregation and condensation protein B